MPDTIPLEFIELGYLFLWVVVFLCVFFGVGAAIVEMWLFWSEVIRESTPKQKRRIMASWREACEQEQRD